MLFSNAQAQSAGERAVIGAEDTKPLQIGDTIPEVLWNLPLAVTNHAEGRDTVRLADYRHKKMIVLDFWATFCVPCIKSVYKLDTLQQKFPDDLAVLLSSSESRTKIEGFFAKQDLSLFSAVAQKELKKYFPHNTIPHQIWISGGVIRAVPKAEQLTLANMENFLKGGQLDVDTKKDIPHYSSAENLASLASRAGIEVRRSSVVTSYIDGTTSSSGIQDLGNTVMANYMNVNIPLIYQHLLQVPNNRIMISNSDYSRYTYRPGQEERLYCLQVVVPVEEKQSLRQVALQEANKIFNLRVDSLLLVRDVYVIRSMDANNAKVKKRAVAVDPAFQRGHERQLTTFVEMLNFSVLWTPDQPIFLDESGFEGKVYTGVELAGDIPLLTRFLSSYGLTLHVERRPVKMYVLHEKKESNIH